MMACYQYSLDRRASRCKKTAKQLRYIVSMCDRPVISELIHLKGLRAPHAPCQEGLRGSHSHPFSRRVNVVEATMEAALVQIVPFSVIIPTKNRPQELDLTIESLLRQTCLPQQIVSVDQSADDSSFSRISRRLSQSAESSRLTLAYVHDVSIPSGARARNRAMEEAEGEAWLFLDDDVYLEPNFLEQLWAAYGRHPGACGISGIITNYPRPSCAFRFWSALFVRGPFRDDRQPVYWNADKLRHAEPVRVTRLGAGLMSFRASAIRHLRFDELLLGVSDGEDVDFCMRLEPGSVLLIDPKARLVHMQSPSGRLNDHWLRRSARASWFLYKKNWNRGVQNRVSFVWLNLGFALVATFASLRHRTVKPWRALFAAARDVPRFVGNARTREPRSRQADLGPDDGDARSSTAEIGNPVGRGLARLRILTTHRKQDHPAWRDRVVLLPGWDQYVAATWRKSSAFIYLTDTVWALRLFNDSRRFDAVVTGSERASLGFALLQAFLRREKVPHVIIDCLWRTPNGPLRRYVVRFLLRRITHSVSRIVVHATRQIEMYARDLGLPKEKFSLVPCHTTLYGAEYPVSDGDYVFSGGDSKRDYRTLIEAARGLTCRVIIAAFSKAHFEGMDIPDNVEILSGGMSFEDFYRLAAGAAVVAVPLQPGLPYPGGQQVYLNAMAIGKPVVVADDCGADEYIANGVTGLVVPAGDAATLREAINTLVVDRDLATSLARNASATAAAFAPDVFIRRVLEIVEDCVDARRGAPHELKLR